MLFTLLLFKRVGLNWPLRACSCVLSVSHRTQRRSKLQRERKRERENNSWSETEEVNIQTAGQTHLSFRQASHGGEAGKLVCQVLAPRRVVLCSSIAPVRPCLPLPPLALV